MSQVQERSRALARVGWVGVLSALRYPKSLVLNGLFVALHIGVVIALWQVVFDGRFSADAGYRLKEVIWYVVVAQALARPSSKVSYEVYDELRDGSVGYRILQPVPYIWTRLALHVGESLVTLLVVSGGMAVVGLIVVGPPNLSPLAVGGLVLTTALSMLITFWVAVVIGYIGFLLGDATPLDMAWSRLTLLLGGGLLPLSFYPEPIQSIAKIVPFRLAVYDPARLFVAFGADEFRSVIVLQLAWLLALIGMARLAQRAAVFSPKIGGN